MRGSHYLGLLLVFGTLFLILTPPLQVPDEPAHFLRSFQVSDGSVIGEKHEGRAGGYLPRVLARVLDLRGQWKPADFKTRSPEEWLSIYRQSEQLNRDKLNDRRFFSFANTVIYPPVPYLPQAAGTVLARAFEVRELTILYLQRALNLAAALAMLAVAFHLVRASEHLTLLYFVMAGTPMALFQMASASPDAVTNGLAYLVVALGLNLKHDWSDRKYAFFLLSSVLLVLTKSWYALVSGLIVPVIVRKQEPVAIKALRLAALLLSVSVPAGLWYLAVADLFCPLKVGVNIDPALQLKYAWSEPVKVLALFMDDIVSNFRNYYASFIGGLGWLDVPIPFQCIRLYWYGLFAVAMVGTAGGARFDLPCFLVNLVIFLLGTFVICTILFLTWNPVGSSVLEGVQGRYFIPLAPLIFTSLPRLPTLGPDTFKLWKWVVTVTWLCIMCVAVHVLVTRYWL